MVEEKNAVAVGWDELGDVSGLKTCEAFKEAYREIYPEHSENRTSANAGQVFRFACRIEQGHYVLTYIKDSREIVIGTVASPYEYQPALFSPQYPHVRRVQWIKRVSRDDFTAPARSSLGSILTAFQADNHLAEIHKLATRLVEAVDEEDREEGDEPPFFEEVSARVNELIADLISHLDRKVQIPWRR